MNYTGPYPPLFTVDVEDGISIAMRDAFGIIIKPTKRVVHLTHKILSIFDENNSKGTFFILGQIAEHYPALIKEIQSEGHEIAIHGYSHLMFEKMNPEIAYQELNRAKKLVEDISGNEVYGHRAPAFSINSNTKWAFDVMNRCGFIYDSSVMPCRSLRYGWPDFNRNITRVRTGNGHEIIEVPMSTVHVLGRDIPACGGSYLRLLPFKMSEKFFNSIARERHPVVYIHPYELDNTAYPDYFFEELKQAPLKTRLALRSNWLRRGTVGDKFKKLMQIRESVPLIDIVNSSESRGEIELFDLGE
jgi:polysaccharide deacetylase family protein (PEP-CTERM system associated)